MLKKLFFTAILIVNLCALAVGQERLVLIGGGERTPEVLMRFAEWTGDAAKSKILVITWASGASQESFDAFKADFERVSKIELVNAPLRPLDEAAKLKFLEQLKIANGVFFTGGDQTRIMEVLRDETLLTALKEKYKSGTVFGGTSAGTAVMSALMITGEGDFTVLDGAQVGVANGLALLPETILDQHFIKRQRQNRLHGLILKNPKLLGIGIDEDTALVVRDNRYGEVIGKSGVMIYDARKSANPLRVFWLKTGGKFDLKKREIILK